MLLQASHHSKATVLAFRKVEKPQLKKEEQRESSNDKQ